jgi:hypothetical protein
MPKGYWAASGKFLKGVGKLLGNAQIPATSQKERRENFPAAIGKNMAISIPFLWRAAFLFSFFKSQRELW